MLKSVHIYGLNAHGIAAAALARDTGMSVTASDLNDAPAFTTAVTHSLPGVTVTFGEHPSTAVAAADFVVVSPGVVQGPQMWQQVTETPNWISAAEFACNVWQWPNRKIVVTGTYGKSTLCALLQYRIEQSGIGAPIAGNYESPVCRLQSSDPRDILIFELDYQQLVTTKNLLADAVVILNIQPDDNVFGDHELYARTKLMAAGLRAEAAPLLATAAVVVAAREYGLSADDWVCPANDPDLDSGLIPTTTAAFLQALLAELKLPLVRPDEWADIAGKLPPGRRRLTTVDAGLKIINDGAAKGPGAVLDLASSLKKMTNVVLITHHADLVGPGLMVVPLADDGAEALAAAVSRAVAMANPKEAVIAYCPGQSTVGVGFESIGHRIEKFEQIVQMHRTGKSMPRERD